MRIPTVVFDCLAQIVACGSMSFLNPTLSDHLGTYGVSVAVSGIIFTLPSISYATTVGLYGFIKLERKTIIMIGLFVLAMANLNIGP